MDKRFREYIIDTRDKFVLLIQSLNLPAEQRVIIEDLLLAYDQLRDAAGDNEVETLIPKMAQVITCKCGSKFAACIEPHCYTDADWLKNVKHYVNAGCLINTIPASSFKFERCTCKDAVKDVNKRQMQLFG